jgi:hypothetical protein
MIKKQSAYKGRGGTNDNRCHPLQADSWESLLKNHLSTNNDSLGTERIDSAPYKLMQILHNMAQVPTRKMVVLELVQCQVQIPKWMQWKVVL